ncbi:LPS assembly outer membrane complex protein LptD [Hartmannibacter diazotrophicus]|uniref:LPS assembly outer membrane complex protein LptD n=1 Tax=Hartmannibacter diazotrophicus TaxID=1482074 RepID=A0A2C9D079_9HYPH|nr:LptA/OstA family protein [Hartmannibacter diazotrophicus]SON53732.1 LPS assembly outer membrane complex protein LptD [Hartmannibacter diazotrophicus]
MRGTTEFARLRLLAGVLLSVLVAAPSAAFAEDSNAKATATMSDAFQGLGVESSDPIQFEAESLEVRESDSMAIFSGNVIARQNKTVLKSQKLTVYYQGQMGQGAQKVSRIHATGNVLVTSGPQTASGNEAVFDTIGRTITVTGNVVLTQGQNVIRGPKLVIDIATSQATMAGGRVQMLIEPKSLESSGKTN